MVNLVGNEMVANFIKHIQYNLLPRDMQEACGKGKDFWCADYWTLEVAKCLFIGNERYMNDPLPRRLENNKSFGKEEIIADSDAKLSMLNFLSTIKGPNNLLICEVGRGLDILVAIIAKKWNKIYCYDHNGLYESLLRMFFESYGSKIIFTKISTHGFDVNSDYNETTMVINRTRVGFDAAIKFFDCPSIIYIIKDGRLLEKLEDW